MADIVTLRSFLSLLLLLLLSSAPLLASSAPCNDGDKKALLAFKEAIGRRVLYTWQNDTDCCEWYGVDCDASTGRVTRLNIIEDDSLIGPIPPVLGDLTALDFLRLHKLPNLVGPIPRHLTNLKRLRFLTITWTNISGPVPAFLADLPALISIDFSFGNLSGPIPAALGEHPHLNGIDLSRNRLTGAIPASLLQGTQDAHLMLSHNDLTGPIPRSFGSVNFTSVDLSRNRLTGDASFMLGRSKPLQQLILSRNQLEFDLTGVVFPEADGNLYVVDLSHNMIYGSIPPQIANAPHLQFLNVSYNRLCGEIPSGGRMGDFDQSSYIHNKCLCGAPLPPCSRTP